MRRTRSSLLNLAGVAMFFGALTCTMEVMAEDVVTSWPTKGWQTSTPEEQGIDPSVLAKLVETGNVGSTDSILIIRNGKVVLDAYYAPYTAELPHVVNSITKSVTGTLVAIAIKDGLLQPNQPVLPFFADRDTSNLDDRKQGITLQHLLDMTSGLDWQEPFGGVPQSMIELERSANHVDFVLNRPMAREPGHRFDYNSGGTHLLSAILTKVTGMRTEDYAAAKLFAPLGITRWKWLRDPQGLSTGGFGLVLHPRDMAKFGYLYLRGGMWEGQQLVPSGWIDKVNHAVVDMHASFAPELRYANLFWARPDLNLYYASGFRCQRIIVYPALDVVAVTTGRADCRPNLAVSIAGAVISASALPPDTAGTERLARAISNAATEKPTAIGAMSPIAPSVSGRTYHFSRNSFALKSLTLTFTGADARYDLEYYARDRSRTETFSGAIGLDGLYRKGMDTPYGPLAAKGRWLDHHVFEVERINIGASEQSRKWTLSFERDKVEVSGNDFSGNPATAVGSSAH